LSPLPRTEAAGVGHGRLSSTHGLARVAKRHLPQLRTDDYRATTLAKLDETNGALDIAFPQAEQRLDDSASALLNADFNEVRET
jgi:hypothetical protein